MSKAPRRRVWTWVALAALLSVAYAVVRHGPAHAHAVSLLLRFSDPNASGFFATLGTHEVDEEDARVTLATGDVPARLYVPRGVTAPPGVVLVHGVHRLGIQEPRLVRFSRAVAATGVVVLTPEVQEIADYRIDPISIDTIGAAAHTLRDRVGAPVGLMGMSFAGGLSLLAAADARFAPDVKLVLAVGAHDDLGRVVRFFATDRAERPDGSSEELKAHGYGALVFVYGNAASFFSPEDVAAARDAVRLWLWDEHDRARERAKDLSAGGQEKLRVLFDTDLASIKPELLAKLRELAPAMDRVSPRGHMSAMKARVFLLHGAGDNVIPATETLWLEQDVPKDALADALVSVAIQHVEIQGKPSLGQQWDIVHFMAEVLEAEQ